MYSLPVRPKIVNPSNLGTADCSLVCTGDDDCDYAVKDFASGPLVPHSEWFCKYLGDEVGIPSPVCRQIEMPNGMAFGSRWVSGHDPTNWVGKLRSGEIEISRIKDAFSRIFAFDLFVQNEDRHLSNYIVHQQNSGFSIQAFDYSRAWMAAGWPLREPSLSDNCNTILCAKALKQIFSELFQRDQSLLLLERLRNVNVTSIERILSCQNDSWLSDDQCNKIVDFWINGQKDHRLTMIEEEISNEKYI